MQRCNTLLTMADEFHWETREKEVEVKAEKRFIELQKTCWRPELKSAWEELALMVAHMRLYSDDGNMLHKQYAEISFYNFCSFLKVSGSDEELLREEIEKKWI